MGHLYEADVCTLPFAVQISSHIEDLSLCWVERQVGQTGRHLAVEVGINQAVGVVKCAQGNSHGFGDTIGMDREDGNGRDQVVEEGGKEDGGRRIGCNGMRSPGGGWGMSRLEDSCVIQRERERQTSQFGISYQCR